MGQEKSNTNNEDCIYNHGDLAFENSNTLNTDDVIATCTPEIDERARQMNSGMFTRHPSHFVHPILPELLCEPFLFYLLMNLHR